LQQRRTVIATWCDRVIEGGWLLALVLIPAYFNLLSARHFEPDKATTLRAIVLVMLAAVLIRWLDGVGATPRAASAEQQGILRRLWQRLRSIPLAVPTLVYAAVFLFATLVSVAPQTSFWGSYQRLQGTYTNLSYMALAAMVALNLRSREQLDRFVTVTVLGSLVAIGYGLVQHFQLDPLPWRGDVISRVASTMGNSIFVAAYLIMVLPFALYRAIGSFHAARRAPPSERAGTDVGWAAAYALLIVGSLALAWSALEFGAVVRTSDLRYWWVYPGALVVGFALYLVPTMRIHTSDRLRPGMLWPAIVTIAYVLLVGFMYTLGQASGGQQVQAQPGRGGTEWPIWMIIGALMVVGAYVLFFTLPRRMAQPSALLHRLAGGGWTIISILIVLTIFFTQSRGPWLGAGISMVFFFTVLLLLALRRARAEGSPRAALWRNLLMGEIGLAAVLAILILAFNFINTPTIERLRDTPYIGRMGRLLDVSPGTTGDVRMKIWFGDDKAGGAVALITSNPLRTLVGWGPESMFVAYNRFYPPSLANVEARGASPDRSHEAYLDELVTKGVLGLAAYLFVLISFFVLAWRLMTRSDDWQMQIFFLACLAVVVAHSVEGLTGIPIVVTLMLLWLTYAATVAGGAISGAYALHAEQQPATEPADTAPVASPAPAPKGRQSGRGGRRGAAARGAQGRTAGRPRRAQQSTSPVGMLVYGIIVLAALLCAWFWNVDNVYADMRFQQGQNYIDSPQPTLQQQLTGMGYLLDAIRMEPGQDFYYLNLGRNLMTISDIRRQTQNAPLGQPKPDAYVEDLLRVDNQAAQEIILNQSLLGDMSYTQAVLQRAYDLSPMNKDNPANLARFYTFWYSRFNQDPKQLQQAIDWYVKAHEAAPQDVVILNEYAGAVALMGNYLQQHGDQAAATAQYEQASALLQQSKELDPKYADTDIRRADLLRIQGKYSEATDLYIAQLTGNPHALDNQISTIVNSMQGQPEQLQRLQTAYESAVAQKPDDAQLYAVIGQIAVVRNDLARARDAYARQTELQPQSFEALRNYTLVLSDTKEYQQAITQAQQLLTIAQNQSDQQEAAQVQALIDFLKQQAQQ
jgi:tetratricopeptide (TPR) repeat protein